MNRSMTFTAVALAASAVSAFSAPAFAADAPTAEVRYSDLSLTTAEGAKLLKARVERAARRICGTRGVVDLNERGNAKQCYRVAVAGAMPQVELAVAHAGASQLAENRISVSAH